METPTLFALGSQRSRWLAERQSVVAENVANANTPAYRAKDVEPFEATLRRERLDLAATQPGHLKLAGIGRSADVVAADGEGEGTHSGNSVNIEQEMMKLGEINKNYSLTSGVLKSFQRFLLMSTRG